MDFDLSDVINTSRWDEHMRKLAIAELKPGMKLAKTIYRNDDGRILLSAESELKAWHIQRLAEYSCESVVVYDPDIESEEELALKPIKDETREKVVNLLKLSVKQIKNEGTFESQDLIEIVQRIVEVIIADSHVVYHVLAIRNHDKYTYSHSVNVCVIAILIGIVMGYDRNSLEILGIGAMLHDIGKIRITTQILNKAQQLEPCEYDMMKKHTLEGYELLKESIHISFLPAHVALQHHEREDGSGYPKGLIGKDIHQFAKIVAVADVFDAMTSDRVYKQAAPAYLAYQEMVDQVGVKYQRTVLEALTKVICPYPKGSIWELSNGDRVIVTTVTRLECLAKILDNPEQTKLYNLYRLSGVRIVACIHE
jgi:HD-GYP domain-containing protein (c-di-GMP phosphodiesterase class II)